jgi:hypothetical protein
MYRQSRGTPVLFLALLAGMLVFGSYFVWRGFLAWVDSGGDITAPVTAAAAGTEENSVAQMSTLSLGTTVPLNLLLVSPTPARECMLFRVIVIRARIRECPATTCATMDQPAQGAQICVYGPAQIDPQYPDAQNWYEVNLDPNDPLPRIGFMRNDLIEPINPTKRPTRTATALPTITPTRTIRPTITLTPSETLPPTDPPTLDPNATTPAVPALPTITPTPFQTPTLPVRSA